MFEAVKGQKIAVSMLKHEIKNNNLPQALLFHGPDGCGKFLTALELARSVNCKYTGSSDCKCSSCLGISKIMSRNIFPVCKSNIKNTFQLVQLAPTQHSTYSREQKKKDFIQSASARRKVKLFTNVFL